MRARRVVYAPEARRDVNWIYDTIAGASSPGVAIGYTERIEQFCERLAVGSERGTLRSDIRPDMRVVGFERRVSIAFSVASDEVLILRIFYGGVDWHGRLRDP